MLRKFTLTLSILAAFATSANASTTPTGGAYDIRVRNAVYNPDQVYLIETDLKFATTIHFGQGERFEAVIAGDTESFEITPITNLGNVVSIKPHVRGAVTNMTIITNRRTYSFELREGQINGRTGRFYEVRFSYPEDRPRRASTTPKGFEAPKNFNYGVSGKGDFQPVNVYDDGRYTYFTFADGTRQPAIFKADSDGRERTINWTQQGNTVRVLGISEFWTLRIDDNSLCVARDTSAIIARN